MSKSELLTYDSKCRYQMEISFDGTEYAGWQVQPHDLTVQELIERALSKLYAGLKIPLTGSSRTDAGVHAVGFSASFAAPQKPDIPPERVRRALNHFLPDAIRIRNIKEVGMDFHARFGALGKAYTYVINMGSTTPFSANYSWQLKNFDINKLRPAAQYLIGTHDFSAFVVDRSKIPDAVRTIYDIRIQQFGNFCCITYIGNGFLYRMVRCLTGALKEVAIGKIPPERIEELLITAQRPLSPETAPAHGLFLMKVFYDAEEFDNFALTNLPFAYSFDA